MKTTGYYARLGDEIGELVEKKQAAYGNSFGKSGDVMRILYPQGIAPAQMDDALAVVRVVDKLFRIATDKDALGESPWRDIAGYGLLGARRCRRGDQVSAYAENQGAEEHDREKREEKCPGNAKYYKPAVGFNPWFFGKDPCRKEASDPAPGKPGDAVLGGGGDGPQDAGNGCQKHDADGPEGGDDVYGTEHINLLRSALFEILHGRMSFDFIKEHVSATLINSDLYIKDRARKSQTLKKV